MGQLCTESILILSDFEYSELPQGGTCENFDRDARVIFLDLKFMKMSIFLGFAKLASFFGG